ncbi:MFS transporter, partial [Rhodococcus erythropolis]|nr:MFS transporter [Rhodococcus erythropolis]
MKKVWLVWGVGVFAYVIAVLHRTSFGVSGLSAADRFSISPSVLSSFVVLQIVVYAGMQIPAGVLLDRYGSRIMIAVGAFIMMSAQLALAFTESLPVAIGARIAVGAGDALTFISVLRLVPQWFPPRQVPLVSQFTGILGQLGQVMSALPFMLLLSGPGWTFAYGSAAAVGLLAFALALSVIRDAPPGADVVAVPAGAKEIGRQIKTVWMRPGTRLGFFS